MLGYKPVHNKQNTHKKEQVSFSCCEMDESRVYNTEWSKSEKTKCQIPYINAYIWNLEKQYWLIYLQRRSGDEDIENGIVDTAWKERVGPTEGVALTYIHYRV